MSRSRCGNLMAMNYYSLPPQAFRLEVLLVGLVANQRRRRNKSSLNMEEEETKHSAVQSGIYFNEHNVVLRGRYSRMVRWSNMSRVPQFTKGQMSWMSLSLQPIVITDVMNMKPLNRYICMELKNCNDQHDQES